MTMALCAATASAQEIDVRLRLAWGGGEARPWQGTIQVSAGTLSEVTPLGLEADTPGSMVPLDAATVRIYPRTPRSYDGCDLRIQAPAEAKLIVQLWAGDAPAAAPVERPLAKIIHGFDQFDLDEHKNLFLAQRSPGDMLRVKLNRDHLIFTPGEKLELEVEPVAFDPAPSAGYLLAAALLPARSDQQLWNEDREVRVEARRQTANVALSVPLPTAEGVYDVRLSLYPKRLTTSLVRGKPLVTRKLQLVVVSTVKTADRQPAAWQSVLEFDPASPKWWERMTRLPSWTRLPNLPQQPVESGPAGARTHLGRSWVELPPQAWQAYPLSVAAPGLPHVLELEYPSDIEQTLGISLVEPNAAGKVGPIGLDSGVDVPPTQPGHKAEFRRHRLVFWPQTRTPYVLLVNRRDDLPALVGKINVLAGPAELPPLNIPQPNFAARMLAAYYDQPLLAENFSASEALDPASGRSFDDWVTFYDAGQRLVQTLQYAGFNAVVLTVACNGSAIYPSRLLEPTPRYDTGVFFESGQDPVRKDVLELLLRLCDRSGIHVIPAVQFAAPLPQLEAIRQSADQEAVGLEPIGPDGRAWIARHGLRRGMGVYYNALDERVQRAMIAVVAELAERYGHHASFSGVAIHLGGDSYSILPDVTCSYDETTISRFVKQTGTQVPFPELSTQPLAALAEFLRGPGKQAWLDWRSAQLSGLFKQMQGEVVRRRADAKLYLTTADLLTSPSLQLALRPALPPPKDESAAILQMIGLRLDHLAEEGIVVPRPERILPASSAASRELNQHWNVHPGLDAAFNHEGHGTALHFLEPAPLRLPDFDAVSPFGADKTRTLLISQIVPASAAQRERFVHSLATLDPSLVIDGGWLLPLGQEAALAPLVKVFRRLPAEPFTTAKVARQPQELVVRTLLKNGKTYFYAVNRAPWPIRAEIRFQSAEPLRLLSYTDERRASFLPGDGGASWIVEMEPFDLVGGELSGGKTQVIAWNVMAPADVADTLHKRVEDAQQRAKALAGEPLPLTALGNPSFENVSASGSIPGWVYAPVPGIHVEVDRTQGSETPSSLHVVSRPAPDGSAPVIWVRSTPFAAPTTGRILVTAMIRVANPARQPKLRLAIEGKLDGQIYYRPITYGTRERPDHPPTRPLTAQWEKYSIPLPDLPTSGLTDLRIGFDLMGEGEVWIDDVQVFDRWLEEKEFLYLQRSIAGAGVQLDNGQLVDCISFMESYWPSFLRRHVPLGDPSTASDAPAAPPAASPSMSARPTNPPPPAKTPNQATPTTSRAWPSWWPSLPKWR